MLLLAELETIHVLQDLRKCEVLFIPPFFAQSTKQY